MFFALDYWYQNMLRYKSIEYLCSIKSDDILNIMRCMSKRFNRELS